MRTASDARGINAVRESHDATVDAASNPVHTPITSVLELRYDRGLSS